MFAFAEVMICDPDWRMISPKMCAGPAAMLSFPWCVKPDWKLNVPLPCIFPMAVFVRFCWKVMVPPRLLIAPSFELLFVEKSRCCAVFVVVIARVFSWRLPPLISPNPWMVPFEFMLAAESVPPCSVMMLFWFRDTWLFI